MRFPVLIVNFKTYSQSVGPNALSVARALEEAATETGHEVIAVPSLLDAVLVKKEVNIPVFVQHADPYTPGAHTGSVTVENVAAWELDGIILNHSERNITFTHASAVLDLAREHGLEVVMCADNPSAAGAAAALNPAAVAVEPPELIGGDVSVSTAKPEVISESVQRVGDVPLLVGAGVKTGEDVRKGVELGAKGVLVASGVVKAADVKQAALDLLSGF